MTDLWAAERGPRLTQVWLASLLDLGIYVALIWLIMGSFIGRTAFVNRASIHLLFIAGLTLGVPQPSAGGDWYKDLPIDALEEGAKIDLSGTLILHPVGAVQSTRSISYSSFTGSGGNSYMAHASYFRSQATTEEMQVELNRLRAAHYKESERDQAIKQEFWDKNSEIHSEIAILTTRLSGSAVPSFGNIGIGMTGVPTWMPPSPNSNPSAPATLNNGQASARAAVEAQIAALQIKLDENVRSQRIFSNKATEARKLNLEKEAEFEQRISEVSKLEKGNSWQESKEAMFSNLGAGLTGQEPWALLSWRAPTGSALITTTLTIQSPRFVLQARPSVLDGSSGGGVRELTLKEQATGQILTLRVGGTEHSPPTWEEIAKAFRGKASLSPSDKQVLPSLPKARPDVQGVLNTGTIQQEKNARSLSRSCDECLDGDVELVPAMVQELPGARSIP